MKKKYTYLIIIFLIVASFIAFGRILGNDFINFDDGRLITENIHIKAGINAESIKWALTNSKLEYWHPLTWLSIMLDWNLFGANASGHHLVSLLWHLGSVILLFLFLSKTTGSLWPSAFVAAFFALHPLRVESVAWAAERKDVLSVFFGMATIYAYAYYAEGSKLSKYFLCLILFALALMSKPMLVTLPCVMLLLDYWPLGRWQKASTPESIPILVDKRAGNKKNKKIKVESSVDKKIAKPVQSGRQLIGNLLWEKVPFFFLALVLSIGLIRQLQKDRLFIPLQQNPFSDRIMNAIVSYVTYLGKTFWPIDLAVFYPYPGAPPLWQFLGALLIFLLISVVIILYIRKLPFLFVGWFWYLGVLFPVIGLMQAGAQTMADRYTYFPSIGIAIILVWSIFYLLPKKKLRKLILIPSAVIVLSVLTFLTWQQCGYWKNSISLFNHVLRATKDNYVAHNNLGAALFDEGKNEEAIHHFLESIEINPYISNAYLNLASALVFQGRIEEAIVQYLALIKFIPNQEEAHSILGVVLADQGKKLADQGKKSAAQRMNEEAIVQYLASIKLNPDQEEAHSNLGVLLAAQGRNEEAIAHYLAAIKINSNYDNAYYNLANLYIKQGKIAEAIDNYRQAIKINPDHFDAHFNLADVFVQQSKIDQAIEHFREAVRITPSSFASLNNLGVNLEKQLKHDEAVSYYRRALVVEPKNPGIYFNLGVALGNKGELKEAIEHFRRAIDLKPDYEEARRALRLALDIQQRQKR
jgi:tetratricopeptide (TPR) repeat protein